ncbi:hypothetical protein PTHTG4_10080 [Parageobacillus thermoglucosidasius]|uniref:hypothetical protein n=1 Tax=Parageobacillus thermoglucosidasius TaxID=1426 RepID=UPI000FF98B6F|nr:hypothetical protein [Parageobacillus thermoglucosidasius]GCD81946.1 hypothetical protein PTHTG4_10080 [Parageobacillus thermoglucosidasius]
MRSVHERIVVTVSAVQFALLALVAVIISDIHDRFFPEQLGVKAKVTLDFSQSGLSDEEAFRQLGSISDRLGLGLMKVAPDLRGDQSGQVFVKVGAHGSFPKQIQRFGNQPDAEIRDNGALAHSFANGDYLVTGKTDRIAEFKDWLTSRRVDQQWNEETLITIFQFLTLQSDFGVTLLAVSALMVSLALYWLAVKARGRALRVLAGVAAWRIQCEDFIRFLMAMVSAAALLDVLAFAYVGFAYGWGFVPYYAKVLLLAEWIVIFLTMACTLALSAASWPSPAMLAMRELAVKSLAKSSAVLKIATFALVLATVAPAFAAYTEARKTAQEQATWKSLADQAVFVFPSRPGKAGGAESEKMFQKLQPFVGDMVREAEAADQVALSLAWTEEYFSVDGFRIAPYRYIIMVNQRWLDLVLGREKKRLSFVPLSPEQIPPDAKKVLEASFSLYVRNPQQAVNIWNQVKIYRLAGLQTLPFVRFGGQLDFAKPNEVILLLVPNVHAMFNDNFLISVASSSELSFTGLEAAQKLVSERGLQNNIRVNYMAEEGILRAQLFAYFAWLRAGSLSALIVALAIAAIISAFIAAVLKAKRDFPLRLGGASWWMILRGRIAKEWLIGGALTVLIMALQGSDGWMAVALAGAMALLALPLVHIGAASWVFAKVSLRQL